MLMGRHDVAQVGTVKYVFEGRKDLDPDVRSIFCRNVSAKNR